MRRRIALRAVASVAVRVKVPADLAKRHLLSNDSAVNAAAEATWLRNNAGAAGFAAAGAAPGFAAPRLAGR